MSPNLLALRNAILSNTLSPDQQGPLADALAAIAPPFPPPDSIASVAPIAADLSDRWFAVLYAINAGGMKPILPARVTTANAETTFGPITPGVSSVLVAVADITPVTSGLLLVSANLALVLSDQDFPSAQLFFIDNLTAISGGTPIVSPHPGITILPDSVTPTFSGSPAFGEQVGSFSTVGFATIGALLTFAGLAVQAVPGHRTGLALVAQSSRVDVDWTTLALAMSVVEV